MTVESKAIVSQQEAYDYLAPDGSEVRLLVNGPKGGLAHCTLPAGSTTAAVKHLTVEELWYVLSGVGEIWRRSTDGECRIDALRAGDSLLISTGTHFQFRAGQGEAIKILMATMPPWPGPSEAVPVKGGL
jgi:mannose-6-phosphate isomerase-like protein (cupin superfamily)